jgi:DHA1 family bicyclomycin/chloramphenicol resistance-like MFS transporter
MNSGLADKRSFVLVLGLLSALVAASIDTILPAIPSLVRELGSSGSLGQQVVGLFMAGIALGQLPAGLISDRIGRMPVVFGGIGIYLLASIVAAVSNDMHILLGARFAQGLGAAVGIALSRAIVRDIASGAAAARLLSMMMIIFTAAPILAPVIGAFLVIEWGWRAPFYLLIFFGIAALVGAKTVLQETHTPGGGRTFIVQLTESLREFFSHRRSVLGVLLVFLAAAGFMAMISGSSVLVVDIYGIPVKYFGYLYALNGISILLGTLTNRRLLMRYQPMQLIGLGSTLLGIAAAQMLFITWLGDAPFWWLWGLICLYMFGTGFVMPNATALALDPMPGIAGVAASVIGTIQGFAASLGAIVAGLLYDGTISNITIVMGLAGTATMLLFIFRKLILGDAPPFEHRL